MSRAGGLCRARGIDGQRYRPIDDPGTSLVEANSCNHAAWSHLKWKLVPLDGAQACPVQDDSVSFTVGIKTRLGKKKQNSRLFCNISKYSFHI